MLSTTTLYDKEFLKTTDIILNYLINSLNYNSLHEQYFLMSVIIAIS